MDLLTDSKLSEYQPIMEEDIISIDELEDEKNLQAQFLKKNILEMIKQEFPQIFSGAFTLVLDVQDVEVQP